MVHVSANHLLQHMALVIIAAEQTRFSYYVQPEAVAEVKEVF